MKNNQERREFVDNPENWHVVELTPHTRMSAIRYKGEERFKLETFEVVNRYDYHDRENYKSGEWVVRSYYKTPENPDEIIANAGNKADMLEPQSLTQIRDWVADQDGKGARNVN